MALPGTMPAKVMGPSAIATGRSYRRLPIPESADARGGRRVETTEPERVGRLRLRNASAVPKPALRRSDSFRRRPERRDAEDSGREGRSEGGRGGKKGRFR